MPRCNTLGVHLIQEAEGCVLEAYPDPGTGGEPWTIGYGHTGPDVSPGMKISQETADAFLLHDLKKFEIDVNNLCAISLNDNQFSALVCFAYNVGVNALAQSTLMRLVNAGNFKEAAAQFLHWIYADGRVLLGLIKRRTAEAALFSKKP